MYLLSGEDVDLGICRDPHTVASLLKQYLRELPEPILTFDMYDSYIAAVRDNRKFIERFFPF